MQTCEVKKGIFVVRNCGRTAKIKCITCQKCLCSEHTKGLPDGTVTCVECYNAKEEQKGETKSYRRTRRYRRWEEYNEPYGPWYGDMRRDFYEDEKYSPFEKQDYDSFERESDTEFLEDGDLPSFFDS